MNDTYKFFFKNSSSEINPRYESRLKRNILISKIIGKRKYFNVLNVGSGGESYLKNNISNNKIKIFDIDISGEVDLQIDLDKIEKLPFKDREFDLAVCLDCLEHLENFHNINNELLRISNNVIISLPISSNEILYEVLLNKSKYYQNSKTGYHSKYYGLPLIKPEDRHRWFLYFLDIIRYYKHFSEENNLDLKFYIPRSSTRRLAMLLLPKVIYYNFFNPHIWIELHRKL